jgi:hypothetical protein
MWVNDVWPSEHEERLGVVSMLSRTLLKTLNMSNADVSNVNVPGISSLFMLGGDSLEHQLQQLAEHLPADNVTFDVYTLACVDVEARSSAASVLPVVAIYYYAYLAGHVPTEEPYRSVLSDIIDRA